MKVFTGKKVGHQRGRGEGSTSEKRKKKKKKHTPEKEKNTMLPFEERGGDEGPVFFRKGPEKSMLKEKRALRNTSCRENKRGLPNIEKKGKSDPLEEEGESACRKEKRKGDVGCRAQGLSSDIGERATLEVKVKGRPKGKGGHKEGPIEGKGGGKRVATFFATHLARPPLPR